MNARLDKIADEAIAYVYEFDKEHDRFPTHDELRLHMNSQFKEKQRNQSPEQFFESLIDQYKQDHRIGQRRVWMYIQVLKQLKKFNENKTLKWNDFTLGFLLAWQAQTLENRSVSTLRGHWIVLKKMLREAKKVGLYKLNIIGDKSLSVADTRSDKHFLTILELMKMYHLSDFDGNEHLEVIRDIFLFDALAAGFRFQDMMNINDSNIIDINNQQALRVFTRKTDAAVYIPSSWYFEEFKSKYQNKDMPKHSNQYFNREIKKIAEMAGINQTVQVRKNVSGHSIYTMQPKYQVVTQYTARYSFATNLFLSGVDIKVISMLLGHAKVATTERYILAKQLDAAMKVSQSDFLQKKPS